MACIKLLCLLTCLPSQIQTSQTEGKLYSDTSPYKVSILRFRLGARFQMLKNCDFNFIQNR